MASYVDMQENGQRSGLLKKSIVSAITGIQIIHTHNV